MVVAAGLAATGGLVAWCTVSNDLATDSGDSDVHCALDAPPLRPAPAARGTADGWTET